MVRWFTLGPVDSPRKPQLYGIHTTVTSWPSACIAFIRGVTTAFTVSAPRADDTLTQSPVLSESFFARLSGISSMGSGTSSFNHGTLRVEEPPHQCSATVEVMSTYGNSSTLPMGWWEGTRGYLSSGLCFTFGCRTFSTGLSTGSYISGSGPSFGT